ncbi:MAG: hypothetical protein BGN92_13510 [Sphingobacteriales bacterium 41-5]|nr:MAG: hypothetical protein BGN92_13510 [Sphingobacteriales bacterium 41-5]
MLDDSTYKLLRELHELLENGVITNDEFAFKKRELLEKANAQAPIPGKDNVVQEQHAVVENQFDFGSWLGKNKWWVVGAFFSLAGLYAGWYSFIRHDPGKDAKAAAALYCNCVEKNYEMLVKVDEDFIKSFSNYNFTTKQLARKKWNELQQSANSQWQQCIEKVEAKKKELARRNKGKNAVEFDAIYNAETNNYRATKIDQYNTLESNIQASISAIKNPTPDTEKIKSDLIGQRTQFWTFNYLSEISGATIRNTTENAGRLELEVMLKLNSESSGEHDAEVIMVYFQDGEDWTFNSVKMNSISYINIAPVDTWQRVILLPNTKHNTDYLGNKIWIKLPCQNDEEIAQGPDMSFDGRRCTYFYIRSREASPVQIKIKYMPID